VLAQAPQTTVGGAPPQAAAADTRPATAATDTARVKAEGRGTSVGPWILLGGGAVAAIAGAVMLGVTAGDETSIRNNQYDSYTLDPSPTTYAAVESAVGTHNALVSTGIALAAVGAVGAAAGLAWMILGGPSEPAKVSVLIGPTGLALRGELP